jgi:hypothetical protein
MVLGIRLMEFVFLHVFLSVIGLGAGVFVVLGFFSSKRFSILTTAFVVATFFTSISGFAFPYHGITPGIVLGVVSVLVLILATYALYIKKLAGEWRAMYVITACLALYFNFFVLVAQAFDKVHVLHSIAPSQTSPGFALSQIAVLVLFILVTVRSVQKFHPAPVA